MTFWNVILIFTVNRFDISGKVSLQETIWMRRWSLFSGKIRKNINLLSAEFTHRVIIMIIQKNNKPVSHVWITNMNCKYESQSTTWIAYKNCKRRESVSNRLARQSWIRKWRTTTHIFIYSHFQINQSANFHTYMLNWAMPRKCVFRACADSKGPGETAFMHSDQGLCCLLPESLDTIECINGEQRPK